MEGRITRRHAFGLAGVTGAAIAAGCARGDGGGGATVAAAQTPSCVLVPEVTEGRRVRVPGRRA